MQTNKLVFNLLKNCGISKGLKEWREMYKTWTSKSLHSVEILWFQTWMKRIWRAAGRKQWMTWKVCEERTIINWVTEIRQYGYNGYLSNVVAHKILHLKCQPLNPYFFSLETTFHIHMYMHTFNAPYLYVCPSSDTITEPMSTSTLNKLTCDIDQAHSLMNNQQSELSLVILPLCFLSQGEMWLTQSQPWFFHSQA